MSSYAIYGYGKWRLLFSPSLFLYVYCAIGESSNTILYQSCLLSLLKNVVRLWRDFHLILVHFHQVIVTLSNTPKVNRENKKNGSLRLRFVLFHGTDIYIQPYIKNSEKTISCGKIDMNLFFFLFPERIEIAYALLQ